MTTATLFLGRLFGPPPEPEPEPPPEPIKTASAGRESAAISTPETRKRQLAKFATFRPLTFRFRPDTKPDTLIETTLKLCRDLAADRREAIAKLIGQNPPPTQQQIAEAVGVTQGRISQVISGILAEESPKLLNHGGKREGQGAYKQVEGKGSNKADYILARLKRDGRDDLAEQVGDGSNTKNETLTDRVINSESARPTPPFARGKIQRRPRRNRAQPSATTRNPAVVTLVCGSSKPMEATDDRCRPLLITRRPRPAFVRRLRVRKRHWNERRTRRQIADHRRSRRAAGLVSPNP